jgi:uncharacterized membrane protein
MAGGFIYTGIDHFVTPERYSAMLPEVLHEYSLELVYVSGVAELAGALGLIIPLAVYRWLELPSLRAWAGVGLALLLSVIVIANINVAIQGTQVQGLAFGAWYYWVRPFLQPIFIAWALYASGAVRWGRRNRSGRPPALAPARD